MDPPGHKEEKKEREDGKLNSKKPPTWEEGVFAAMVETLKGSSSNYMQVWTSFGVSGLVAATGLYFMDLSMERKGFLGMGYLFMTASSFTLAKTIRDREEADKLQRLTQTGIIKAKDSKLIIDSLRGTSSWFIQVGTAFATSVVIVGIGLYHMPISMERKGFLGMGALFLLSSTFNLAKTVRDQADAYKWELMLNKD